MEVYPVYEPFKCHFKIVAKSSMLEMGVTKCSILEIHLKVLFLRSRDSLPLMAAECW